LQTFMPSGQSVTEPGYLSIVITQVVFGAQPTVHVALPGHVTEHAPSQSTSQSPEPVHAMFERRGGEGSCALKPPQAWDSSCPGIKLAMQKRF
jgi:hypothetical protein